MKKMFMVLFVMFAFGCTNTLIDLSPPCEADAGCDDMIDACDGDTGEDCY